MHRYWAIFFTILTCVIAADAAPAVGQSPESTTTLPPVSDNPRQELNTLATRARELGISPPRMSVQVTGGTTFEEVMPAVVELIDSLRRSTPGSNVPESEIEALRKRASNLLVRITQAERSPRVDEDPHDAPAEQGPGR